MKSDFLKKYNIYNSLFLDLYYQDTNAIGYLIPLLGEFTKKKLAEEQSPIEIIDSFYQTHKESLGIDKFGFMFKVIQYVERQIVLFDAIEDNVSPYDLEDQNVNRISDFLKNRFSHISAEELIHKINDFSVRIVLTAHPTQFYRKPVLEIISKLRKQIKKSNIEKINDLLLQLGLTSLVNSKSPTPIDEAKNIIHICRHYYYDAIGEFYHKLQTEFPQIENPNLFSLGFWPCGDRDGNPYVTHHTTLEVIDELRMNLMKCYYKDFKSLCSKLTFKEVEHLMQKVLNKIYTSMFSSTDLVDHEEILECLTATRKIVAEKYEGLFLEDIDLMISKVSIFKSHFASLDIRQDHSVHYETITYLLKKSGTINESLNELAEDELVDILMNQSIEINDLDDASALVKDTIENIRQLPSLQKKNGIRGCHRYIISNSEDIFSVLFVFGLFRWVLKQEDFDFDIIPLFETIQGMNNCEAVMDKVFSIPKYNAHMDSRKNKQTIMLGFSDGTKDGGYLKANWSIFKSKEILTAVCEKHNIKAIFFDGRGGPPARGGGKTHNFYAALGSGIANHEVQLTIQGQTITSTYGTSDKFIFNAEQMASSGLFNFINKEKTSISSEARLLIDQLAEDSYFKYKELKSHPKFLPYLEHMTTLKYYAKANIGSRPGKRNKEKELTLSDLRAISYVGSWSQLKQNIPGYFGIGYAINKAKENGQIEAIKTLYKEVPFFRTLLDNCMMSLKKCFFELTAYMKSSDSFGAFWQYLYEEYSLSKSMVLEISEQTSLMQLEANSRMSIETREDIVLPLVLIQNYALQMRLTDQDTKNDALYDKLITRSLYGNINASRNSA